MQKGGFDYSEFEKLFDSVKSLEKEFDSFLRSFLLRMANRALAKTKRNTPVDTGDLRNRWEITDVYKVGPDLVIGIRNNLEYASFVELGHLTRNRENWVEGYFMCTIALDEINRQIPARFEKEFAEWVRKLGGA